MSSGFQPLGRLRALGFLAFAALDIGSEAAGAQRDVLVGMRILAERLRLVRARLASVAIAVGGELAGEVAVRIVGAADEGAVFAELQRQLAGAADLADARIGAVFALREDQRRQLFVQRIEHIGDAQFLGAFDLGEEILPEVAQHLLPVEFAGRNPVELFFEIGGEIIFDIALEEAFQEGRDQPALGLRDQLALVDASHIRGRAALRASRHRSKDGRCRALPSS